MAATASRNGAGSAAEVMSAAPLPRSTLHRRRGSQKGTVDLSADTPRQARRFLLAAEPRRALLAVRGEPFPDVGAAEPDEFQPQRRLESGPEHAVPVIEAVFCPADRILRAARQILGDARCGGQHVV